MIWKLLFIIAGILWGLEMTPQLWTTWKTKNIKSINIAFPIICLSSFIIFFIACIGTKNWIVLLSNIIPFVCVSIWLGMIFIYRRK